MMAKCSKNFYSIKKMTPLQINEIRSCFLRMYNLNYTDHHYVEDEAINRLVLLSSTMRRQLSKTLCFRTVMAEMWIRLYQSIFHCQKEDHYHNDKCKVHLDFIKSRLFNKKWAIMDKVFASTDRTAHYDILSLLRLIYHHENSLEYKEEIKEEVAQKEEVRVEDEVEEDLSIIEDEWIINWIMWSKKRCNIYKKNEA